MCWIVMDNSKEANLSCRMSLTIKISAGVISLMMLKLSKLSLELLYIICEYLDTDDLLVLARLKRWYNYHLAILLSERIDPKDADMKEVPINKKRNAT
ncbi:hypothetical protein BD408DRAFT_45696 [Parasitella parasitica]|nr:hypothetical protein BD408DRAFT_45696 [Parasitella parasitica]